MPDEPDLGERVAGLETRVAVLMAQNELLTDFAVSAIARISPDEFREALRGTLERKIWVASKSMQLDRLNDLNNLLRAFEAAIAQLP